MLSNPGANWQSLTRSGAWVAPRACGGGFRLETDKNDGRSVELVRRAGLPVSPVDFPLTSIFLLGYIPPVEWVVEYTDEFERWWSHLSEDEQEDVNAKVILLQRFGPALRRPHSGVIACSKHSHMKELIIQHAGRPYRVLYAFHPRRCAILLIGGDKTGDDRWYEKLVPIADRLYDEHLAALEKEGSTDA